MKQSIAKKVIIITTLALVIFASFSVVIINYLNFKALGETVIKVTDIYSSEIKKFTSQHDLDKNLSEMKDAFHITIMMPNGVPIGDSILNIDELSVDISRKDLANIKNGNYYSFIQKSKELNRELIYYAVKVENFNLNPNEGYVILRVGTYLNYESRYFIMMVPLLIGVLFLVIFLSYTFTNNLISSAVAPFDTIKESLESINRGEFPKIQTASKYDEMQNLMLEINNLSVKIASNVNYLNYEKQKNSFLLTNMQQGLVAVSDTGKILVVNQTAQLIFDSVEKNMIGLSIYELLKEMDIIIELTEAIEEGKSFMFEHIIDDKNYRIEISSVKEDWFEDFREVQLVLLFTDVTHESRSAEIRSEFFANASHELKTPLTAIKGFAELMEVMPNIDHNKKFATEINANANRMLNLINDMLKLSKMEAKIYDGDNEIIELGEIASDVKGNISAIANINNIAIKVSGKGEIFGNKKSLTEVVTNLMDNAIKYNKKNGKVDVCIYEKDLKVYLIVADNGIGIESAHQSRIFERFYRVDKGRNRKITSTGLGLAIVKHIVLMHHGKIKLESTVNVGTKFTVEFPKYREE